MDVVYAKVKGMYQIRAGNGSATLNNRPWDAGWRLVLDEVPWCDEATKFQDLEANENDWCQARRPRHHPWRNFYSGNTLFQHISHRCHNYRLWRQLRAPKILLAKSKGDFLRYIMTSSSKEAQGAWYPLACDKNTINLQSKNESIP